MNTQLFQKSQNKIAIFRYKPLTNAVILLTMVFLIPYLTVVFFIYSGGNEPNIIAVLISFVIMLLILFPFYYLLTLGVIIDGSTQKIYKKSLFGLKPVADLSEAKGVAQVQIWRSMFKMNMTYYELEMATSYSGNGIKLLNPYRKDAPLLIEFEKTGIPFINSLIASASNLKETDSKPSTLLYFRQQGTKFVSVFFSYTRFIIALLFLAAAVYAILEYNSVHNIFYFVLFTAIMFVSQFRRATHTVQIDPVTQIITISYWGLFKHSYSFSEVNKFSVRRQFFYGLFPIGNDIRMTINRGSKEKSVFLFHNLSNKINAQRVIDEIKSLAIGTQKIL